MNKIFISKINEKKSQEIIIEGDDHSIWAYLLDYSNENTEIEFDGFICSRGTLVETNEEIKSYINKVVSAPLIKKYSNEYSIQKGIKNEDIKINWQETEITIKLNGIEFLIMDLKNKISYSKSISKKGPYGIPITQKINSNKLK